MADQKVELISVDEETGLTVFNLDAFADSADWLNSARLKERADNGDEDAKKELEILGKTKTIVL